MRSPMSGTQSTLADRTPNILNKDHPLDKKHKNDKSHVSLKHEFDPTGLVQRCVIIQRDENGFGLTVSGDNPVFVQLVKEDGAAMRAGVQTGDRIIKVNGTLVTHSNHIEVVKLIKSGSYVALTVLGRPPGLPQIPLEVEEAEVEGGEVGLSSSLSAPQSPALLSREQCSPFSASTSSPQDHMTYPLPPGDGASWPRDGKMDEREGELSQSEQPRSSQSDGPCANNNSVPGCPVPESPSQRETPCHSTNINPQDAVKFCPSTDTEDTPDMSGIGNSPAYLKPQIIGAEDDYFDTQQVQLNGQCSSFQNIELMKTRPAHLAAFLHHVVSQFDPSPLLCYLYADLHKQANSKESRRLFMDFYSLFIDRGANLKVPVPELISTELERRRLELIPEELCKQYTQLLQDTLLPELNKNLEDFRQKRSMGLTLADDELSKLDSERGNDHLALEKECSCAEHIVSKIEDILLTSQPTEEEKSSTIQYVILTYMKHLGVKVKEPRSLEPKRLRINFLPKIKVKSIKPEKEGEEKVRKPRFPNILGQPRRPSRVDSTSVGRAIELNKQRSPKQLSQPANSIPEHPDSLSGGVRGSQSSDCSDASTHTLPYATSTPHSSPTSQATDNSGQESDSGFTPTSFPPRQSDSLHSGDSQDADANSPSTHFDFSPCTLDQLQEEEQDTCRVEGLSVVGSPEVQSEDDQGTEVESKEDPLNWQRLVSREVLANLTPQEIKRQEVINELLYTERAHLRMLKVLDSVFYQRLNRDSILPPEDIKHIFTNLDEIIQLHVSVTEHMTAIRKRTETSVIGHIGDDLLAWFSGEEEGKIKKAVGTFCSNQPSALELIKSKQKKDQRFTSFMQEAESNRLCRRLQLKDIIPIEMQRLTKYPLLLGSIAKYTEDPEETDKVKRAGECCRKILNHVNQAVKEAENKQRLEEYQRRLDLSSLKQSENPMILEFKNLDLTKRKMVHEGPLSWKVNKDKTIELYTILLEDILVLLQKQDERLVLKCHSKNLAGTADTKHIFSPIIKLNTVMVRPVATDNKSFFVLSMSDNGAQIYELMAQSVSEQRTWQCLITQCADAMKSKHNRIPLDQSDAERDTIEIINADMPKPSKDYSSTESTIIHSPDKDTSSSPGLQAQPSDINPFEDIKSEDEQEGSAMADREDEEVYGEEFAAFLEDELADKLPFLQERSRQGIAIENHEQNLFGIPSSVAEEALNTLAVLKQVLLNHIASKGEEEEEREETEDSKERRVRTPGCLQRTVSLGSPENSSRSVGPSTVVGESAEKNPEKEDSELPAGHKGLYDTAESNGSYIVFEWCGGSEESNTDNGRMAGDVAIDLKKLLSSSQTGGSGPNLNRQLMTHLRLLQANLQHLKEVEVKYNQLCQIPGEMAVDSEETNDRTQ
ncbi:rho guanine nucleotide exchange factor 12 isoform X2 [Lampris incognitus]|uniref:rho guanine nucleotide exchange factor 12 isoform X2 n=1 Tax=Lampris incognitus TaxID=2546036 RepID=UPI0024B56137|nr:rho guanine nucleotide exchange factor 12 isoform X2 [Lampris incognitus]